MPFVFNLRYDLQVSFPQLEGENGKENNFPETLQVQAMRLEGVPFYRGYYR